MHTAGEYLFLVGKKQLSKGVVDTLDAIARKNGACFEHTYLAKDREWRSWFAGLDLGFPFARELERAVEADIKAAGIDY